MVSLSSKQMNAFISTPSLYGDNSGTESIDFNIQLQKLAAEIAYIGGLEASGQISAQEAYDAVKLRWKEFQQFKKGMDQTATHLRCA